MRGKQSDLSLWTGITITLSCNYPRSHTAVGASPHWLLFLSPRCTTRTSLAVCYAVCLGLRQSSCTFPSTSVLNWISPFIFDCHVFDLLLHPPSIHLQITGAQEDRNEAADEENRVIELTVGSWRITEGPRGASYSELHTELHNRTN